MGPLDGVRVIDFSQFMAGPVAAQKLGDYGADVIKVERPGIGEGSRHASAANYFIGEERSAFVALNRNKRSITLNLKTERGRDLALQLIKEADVVIENFRPGVMERLGLGYIDAEEVNPAVIYASITGYGTAGPDVRYPGQDLLVQSLSGLVNLNGSSNVPPTAVGLPVIDAVTGQQLALGIVTALFQRERTGLGQHVEVSLLNTAVDLQAQEFTIYLNCGEEPGRSTSGIAHPYFMAPYGIYRTADGHLALAHTPIAKLAELFDLPELRRYDSPDLALQHRDWIYEKVQEVFETHTTEEWLTALRPHDMWCAPVRTYSQLEKSEQIHVNRMIIEVEHPTAGTIRLPGIPISFSKTPGSVRRPPPSLGEHTEEICGELGITGEEIIQLRKEGVV